MRTFKMPWTDKEIEKFLPYLYKQVRLEYDRINPDKKLRKPLSDSQVLDWYQSDLKFKNYADKKLDERIKKAAMSKGIAGKVGGKVTYEKLKNSGYFESPKWKAILSENGKKMGKIQGKINVESGHLAEISKIMTPKKLKSSIKNGLKGIAKFESMPEDFKHDARSRGGKTSGNNAVKSGQFAEFVKAGVKASIELRRVQTLSYKQKLYDLIQLEEFTIKDISHLYKEFNHIKNNAMIRIWIRDADFFECIGVKGGNSKVYKKVTK